LGFVITFQVMTVAQVSPHDQNAVDALAQGVHYQVGVNHPGTIHPNDPEIWRVLQPGDASQIGSGIGAPVAEKSENDWFKVIRHGLISL
jgi:hypothetical protein